MKVIPYLLGIITYNLVGFASIVIPINTRGVINIYTNFFSGLLTSILFVYIQNFVFGWFGYEVPFFFIILFLLGTIQNNIARSIRKEAPSELGYLFGEVAGLSIGYYGLIYYDIITYKFW